MIDLRAQWTEEAVGANDPEKADVINRLVLVEHNIDGTHEKLTVGSDADGDSYARINGVLARIPKGLDAYSFWALKNLRLIEPHTSDHTKVTVNPAGYGIPFMIGEHAHIITAAVNVSSVTDLDTGVLAAGTDYYIYACTDGTTLSFKASANSTNPTGFDAAHSRKIGGFHTLCVAAGAIAGHTLTNYAVKDILPATVWCLKNRARNLNQVGQLWNPYNQQWEDIYLASDDGAGGVQSVYNAAILDTLDWNTFVDRGGKVGKKLFYDGQFQIAAAGSNEETNIAGSSDPETTGGHSDTAGRRMISNLGHEDMCGAMWQWLQDQSSMQSADAAGWYDLPGSKGSLYRPANTSDIKLLAGGSWGNAANCGSRSRAADDSRWAAGTGLGARFIAEPL